MTQEHPTDPSRAGPRHANQSRADRIAAQITAALAPSHLAIEDESHRHAGHAGAQPGGETHYRVEIVSDRFSGLSRVARSRLVHACLAAEFAGGLHALSLTLRSPGDTLK